MKIVNFLLRLFTICVIILVIIGFILQISTCNNKDVKNIKNSNIAKIEPKNELNLENVWDELIYQGVKYPNIVFKQCILETGHLNSYNARVRNNLFGLYFKNKYLIFVNYKQSIKYYKEWQNRHYKGGDYLVFLSNIGYAEDTTYIDKLKLIKIKFE